MKTVLICPAKINLFLWIHPEDHTGYHPLDTVFVRTEQFQDKLHIEPNNTFTLTCSDSSVPCDESNTVTQAIRHLESHAGRPFNYKIHIEKEIPVMAGLGGGSSNAASVLVFLNEHEGLGLSHNELMTIGSSIGKDVPFFLSGFSVAKGTGYGDQIAALPELPTDLQFSICPGPKVPTAEAFKIWDAGKFNQNEAQKNEKMEALLKALDLGDTQKILENTHNDFDAITTQLGVSLSGLSGSAHLSGSGGAVVVFDLHDKTKTVGSNAG